MSDGIKLLDILNIDDPAKHKLHRGSRNEDGENPLDASAVHPESYFIVEKMAKDIGCTVKDLISFTQFREKIINDLNLSL